MSRLSTLFTRFRKEEGGTVAIIFGLTSLIACGITGLAIDFGRAMHAKAQLKVAVDYAAIAGASLPATANLNRINVALKYFGTNLTKTNMAGVTPDVVASNASVTVTASFSQPTVLMKIFRLDTIDFEVSTTARSQVQNGGVACLIALSPNSDNGLHLQGINKVSSDNCWAWVNSTSEQSINAVGASIGSAQGFCTAGKVLGGEHFSPYPYTECDPIPDPFKTKINGYQAAETCEHTNLQLSNGTYTLQPGVYCGNTVFKPQADVTLQPGTYIFKDGYLQVQAGATLSGNGVTLFFTHANTYMEVRGGANVDLKAPATGDLAGFVIVDRLIDWYDTSIRETVIQGGGSVKIEGILYAPQWKVTVSGNGDINQTAKYFTAIADSFYMEGNGKLYIQSDAAGAGLPDLMPKIKNGPLLLN